MVSLGLRRRFFVLLLPAIATLLAACSSGNSSDADAPLPTAQETLEQVRAAMHDVTQFEFELTHPNGTTTLEGGLSLRRAEGTVIVPRRLKLSAEADLGRIFVKVDAIVIEGETWMTNPLTGNWSEIAPSDSPFSFLDPVSLVSNVVDQTHDPYYPDDRGRVGNNIVFEGQLPSEALRPLVGEVLPGKVVTVKLTVDSETFLLRTAELRGIFQDGDSDDFVRLIRFSGYDSALVIEPPN